MEPSTNYIRNHFFSFEVICEVRTGSLAAIFANNVNSLKVNFCRRFASSRRVNEYLKEIGCLVTTDSHICVRELRVWVGIH